MRVIAPAPSFQRMLESIVREAPSFPRRWESRIPASGVECVTPPPNGPLPDQEVW